MKINILSKILAITAMASIPALAQTTATSPYWRSDGNTSDISRQKENVQVLADASQQVVDATGTAVRAKWDYYRVQNSLSRRSNNMVYDYYNSKEYVQGLNNLKNNHRKLSDARDKALEDYKKTPEYIGAYELRGTYDNRIKEELASKNPDFDKINALSQLKIEALKSVRIQEAKILDENKDIIEAKKDLNESFMAMRDMDQNLKMQVRNDPDLNGLMEKIWDAKVDSLVANAVLNEQRNANKQLINATRPRFNYYSPYVGDIWGINRSGFWHR